VAASRLPEQLARSLLRKLRIRQPVDLEMVAPAIGLCIRREKSTGFEGALTRIPGRALGVVVVRRGQQGSGRERFTIAHEIGHYLLPGHGSAVCSGMLLRGRRGGDEQEVAANRFAAELLLPAAEVMPILRKRPLSVAVVKLIAQKFSASLTAAAFQCVEVTGESCAAVVSIGGIRRYYKTSRTWRYVIAVGRKIDDRSVAARLGFETSAAAEVPAIAWTTSKSAAPGARLVENSIYLAPYNMTLSILTAMG
jgi:hypothetical protein